MLTLVRVRMVASEMKLLSKDGIYLAEAPRDITAGWFGPGNRADILVRCADPGLFKFESTPASSADLGLCDPEDNNDVLAATIAHVDVGVLTFFTFFMTAGNRPFKHDLRPIPISARPPMAMGSTPATLDRPVVSRSARTELPRRS